MEIEKLKSLYESLDTLTKTFEDLNNELKQPDTLTFALDENVSPKVSILVENICYLYDEIEETEFCKHLSKISYCGYYEYQIWEQIRKLEVLYPLGYKALDSECFKYSVFFNDEWYYNNFNLIYHEVSKKNTELSKIFTYYFPNEVNIDKPQQIKQQEDSTDNLPSELNTEEALKYLAKAKENGLINDNYEWLKGKQLLACFCHDMSQKLNLGKGDRVAWKPFERLFGTTSVNLRNNYNDIQKTGQSPSDISLVDSIFQ